jgi:hypothetical protein
MAEVRLYPGNPRPAIYKNTAIEMASALVAERQDGARLFIREKSSSGAVRRISLIDVEAQWGEFSTGTMHTQSLLKVT